jgi:signal transduction histidine kinase
MPGLLPLAQRQGDPRRVVVLRNRIAAVVLLLALATLGTAIVPPLRIALYAPDLRLVIEVVGLCVGLFTAFALLTPATEGDHDPATNAFVAAIVTLGASNAIFGVGPILLHGDAAAVTGFSFYPWLVARYVAGVFFIVASVRPPRLRATVYVALALAAMAIADLVVVLLGQRLPVPIPLDDLADRPGAMTVDVSTLWASVVVTALPGVLFGLGAWLAWRVFVQRQSRIFLWLCLALWILVLAQVQEVLEPAVLGPVITTADVLRTGVIAVLATGALLQVRELFLDRTAAVQRQAEDLQAQGRLLADMREFTEREEAFRALVVHELATPIATLRGFARLLTSGRFPEAETRAALQGIESESRRLQQLARRMEELRTLELEHFQCDLRPVLLRPLLEDAALYVRGLPGTHPASVQCAEGVRVHADPVRLGQALRNLLTNAARYSPDGTPISVEAGSGPDGCVRISVADQGPGVLAEERRRVLGKYERGAAARGAEGAGLGLYVASRIADAHEGRLYFADTPAGNGTLAVLELREAG